MASQELTTDAFVLLKRPPADSFQTLTLFSPTHGNLLALLRLPKKNSPESVLLDLFDEAAFQLESGNQGRTWFIRETRLIHRPSHLSRSYETLQRASALATLVTRNDVHEDARPRVYALLRTALAAFATTDRADIVYLKTLYCFARDEGYPLKQHWFPELPAPDREHLALLLNQPLANQTAAPATVARLQTRLETYLITHTEILLSALP